MFSNQIVYFLIVIAKKNFMLFLKESQVEFVLKKNVKIPGKLKSCLITA
jgi:hypothetical protein